MPSRALTIGVLVAVATVLAGAAAPAHGAYPGLNGKLAFDTYPYGGIWTAESDGSAAAQLTNPSPSDIAPAWSPDGQRIAYAEDANTQIAIVNPDGSGKVRVGAVGGTSPTWSPDGTQIIYARHLLDCDDVCTASSELRRVNADGSGDQLLISSPGVRTIGGPAWSPDGRKVAFTSGDTNSDIWMLDLATLTRTPLVEEPHHDYVGDWSPDGSRLVFSTTRHSTPGCNPSLHDCRLEIYSVNADGNDQRRLTENNVYDTGPAWSPDGTKILFSSRRDAPGCASGCNDELYVMDADGTDPMRLTNTTYAEQSPDWQPIPVNAYPRPKGASPMDASLVPAFEPCTSPNRTHGPPLAFGSCSPPAQAPGQLTVGTPDANGQGAKSAGSLWMKPRPGDPSTPADEADVALRANITDVRLRSDLSDYFGSLEVRLSLQITDKDNTPHPGGPGPATVQELTQSYPVPCTATADTTVGSTCGFDTTIEAFVPGAVKELERAIWHLGPIRVHDGTGNLFLTQGVFVP